MNRSYSKLRHIQEMNKRLDNKRIEESYKKPSFNFINEQGEKKVFMSLLERQRLLEENLKHYVSEEEDLEDDIDTEEEDLDGEISDEEFDDLVTNDFPNEWKEFETQLLSKIMNSPEANEGGDTETLTESEIKSLLVEGRCNLQTKGLFHCIRYSKFGRWWVKKIGKPTVKGIENFAYNVRRKFKAWMRDIKNIDIDLHVKKKRKKRKYKPKSSKSKKRLKPLQKYWIGDSGSAIKIGRVKWLTFGKSKDSESMDFESEEDYENEIDPIDENLSGWKNFINENEAAMIKIMNPTSRKNWAKLKAEKDPKYLGYAVNVLDWFLDTNEESKWTKCGVGMTKEEFEYIVDQDPQPEDEPPIEKVYPFKTYDFPMDLGSEPNLFKDNQWDESNAENFKNQILKLCEVLKQEMALVNPPEGQPKVFLKEAWLASSASRLRNQAPADQMSFLELSNKRMETAKAIIIREFAAIGVLIDSPNEKTIWNFDTKAEKSEHNPFGNGDGSSGPNGPKKTSPDDPFGVLFIPLGNYKMSPACANNVDSCVLYGKTAKRDQCGTPHETRAEYDKYKYIKGSFQFVFNDTIKPEIITTPGKEDIPTDEPDVTVIEHNEYPIHFYAPGKTPFRIPLPGLRIKWKKLWNSFKFPSRPNIYGPPPGKKNGDTKCEAFGTGFGG